VRESRYSDEQIAGALRQAEARTPIADITRKLGSSPKPGSTLGDDRYADGDRERLHEMWMSGELNGIYLRDGIETLRRHGKHDLADHYERALANTPPPQPIDYVAEALRSLGLE
jgi:hypothetical protein